MRSKTLRRLELLSVATAGVMIVGGSVANAQAPYYPQVGNTGIINTFDTASSFSTVASYNPPPMIVRTDGTVFATNVSAKWSNGGAAGGFDNTASTGGPALQGTAGDTGGSLKLSQTFSTSAGSHGMSWTFDIYPGGFDQMATSVSFDILVDPKSTGVSQYNDYGYFQLAQRSDSYGYTRIDQTLYENGKFIGTTASFGGSTYSGPGISLGNSTGSPDVGVWDHIEYDFSTPQQLRAITLQDFSRGGTSGQNGTVIYDIDNLDVGLVPVPEPASLGLLALGVPALLKRRRPAKA
jgi:hypothetical protein